MSADSITAYEMHAAHFLQHRDVSTIGVRVVSQWAASRKPGPCVIEIACGGGLPVTRALIDAGLEVWAIDASPSLIATFQARFPEVPVKCESVQSSDYFERNYDAAIAIGLIFLLSEEDQFRMLSRVAEVLNPGGHFLFTAPVETGSWADMNTGHLCRSLGREVYQHAMNEAGLRIVGEYEDSGRNHYYATEKLLD